MAICSIGRSAATGVAIGVAAGVPVDCPETSFALVAVSAAAAASRWRIENRLSMTGPFPCPGSCERDVQPFSCIDRYGLRERHGRLSVAGGYGRHQRGAIQHCLHSYVSVRCLEPEL